jgi:hypothetical protein
MNSYILEFTVKGLNEIQQHSESRHVCQLVIYVHIYLTVQ